MVKRAFIFPGQGAQYVGMGRDIYNKYKSAASIFEEANSVLDFDLIKVCFEGPLEELSKTDISQPAILTVSIATLKAFWETTPDIKPQAVAGLSLGEYSALVAAGAFSFKDAVKLVRKRGQLMEEASKANPGKMLSIIGLERVVVKEICDMSKVEIANLNCPGQIVVSGTAATISKAEGVAKEKGAKKAIILDVSGPFHSSLMNSAAISLGKELESLDIKSPEPVLVSNVTANYSSDTDEIKKNLITQVDHSINWEDSMKLLIKDGFSEFFEIGPGKVLKGLMRRIDSSISVKNVEKVEDLG